VAASDLYRTWKDQQRQPILDGTNNADERAIGWWVKERYRHHAGYKREQIRLECQPPNCPLW